METKHLVLNDNMNSFNDEVTITNEQARNFTGGGMGLKGRVIMRDEQGNTILEKDNLIVLRGRTFALEKLFEDVITAGSGYKLDITRKIGLFKIGSGGANVATAPFSPYTPIFSDENLGKQEPMVIVDVNKAADPLKQANPSIVTSLSTAQQAVYYDGVVQGDGTTHYFAKTFDANPVWTFNKVTNEVYKKIQLTIATTDARNKFINELGLFISKYNSVTKKHDNIELFSRICFDTESLTNLTKQISVEYFIYA